MYSSKLIHITRVNLWVPIVRYIHCLCITLHTSSKYLLENTKGHYRNKLVTKKVQFIHRITNGRIDLGDNGCSAFAFSGLAQYVWVKTWCTFWETALMSFFTSHTKLSLVMKICSRFKYRHGLLTVMSDQSHFATKRIPVSRSSTHAEVYAAANRSIAVIN